jgi:predicted nucleotidyltransferase
MVPPETLKAMADVAAAARGLRLLVLFGSRARGDAHAASDWDLGFVGSAAFDPDELLAALVKTLGTDHVDLVDLSRGGAQLRFRAARDGQMVFEDESGQFGKFWLDAVSFWCDVQPILQVGYERVLADLGP